MSTFDVSQVRRPQVAPSRAPKIMLAIVLVAVAFGGAFAAGKVTGGDTNSVTPVAPKAHIVKYPAPSTPSLSKASSLPGLKVVHKAKKHHVAKKAPASPVTTAPPVTTTPHYTPPAT